MHFKSTYMQFGCCSSLIWNFPLKIKIKLVPFSCGWVTAPGHSQLHRLPFQSNNHSWLLAGQLRYVAFMGKEWLISPALRWSPKHHFVKATWWHESELLAHTACLCAGTPAPNPFPPSFSIANVRPGFPSHWIFTYIKIRGRFLLGAISRLCVARLVALTTFLNGFYQRMARHCTYPSLHIPAFPNSKFK